VQITTLFWLDNCKINTVGHGTFTFNDQEERKELCGNFFQRGEFDGVKLKMDNGSEGLLSHTVVDVTGEGKVTFKNGDVYEGGFVNGVYEGHGKLTWTRDKVTYTYEGAFKKGKYDGEGVFNQNEGE
jgi:hypothetical protein